jgi:hypothetical protein
MPCQASLTKAEMECDEARSELRGKAISLEVDLPPSSPPPLLIRLLHHETKKTRRHERLTLHPGRRA